MTTYTTKSIIAVILAGLAAIITGCTGMMSTDDPTDQSARQANVYLSPRFSVYGSKSDSKVTDNYYFIKFHDPASFEKALAQARTKGLEITHVLFDATDGSSHGGVAAYNGKNTLVSDIDSVINTHDIDLANTPMVATGFQAVIDDPVQLEEIQQDEAFALVKRIEFGNEDSGSQHPDPSDETGRREAVTELDWEPDEHRIRVYAYSNDRYRAFEWEGKWTSQTRLARFRYGDRPAFEPDIKLRFSTFLWFFPTRGWAEPNPTPNNALWRTNMPGGYLDTQFSDTEWRAYTVGSTMNEKFQLNVPYYYKIYTHRWNSTSSRHRQLYYKLTKWTYHRIWCESWTWCVGIPLLTGGRSQGDVFSPSAHTAPFYSPLY